jgi:hypothetical protein
MADTIREKIIKAAMAQLAKIKTSAGYNYTMVEPLRGKTSFDPAHTPVSVVFAGTEENVRQYGRENLTMLMRVESHMVFGDVNASVVQEKLLGDLRKNLTDPADVWTKYGASSNYAEDIGYAEGGPAEQPEPSNTVTAVYVALTVKYKTDIGDPYTNT